MFNLFKQKTATLFNGKKVTEGDNVYFINSDGERCDGVIQRRKFDVKITTSHKETTLKKGSLFFWNAEFMIEDYANADLCGS